MKKILMAFAATFVFGSVTAQLEPKTSQKQDTDSIALPRPVKSEDNIANRGIIKQNTIESGLGKPDNIKRKKNKPLPPQPAIKPRVFTDTTKVQR
jgi:hypothetical protein